MESKKKGEERAREKGMVSQNESRYEILRGQRERGID